MIYMVAGAAGVRVLRPADGYRARADFPL